MKNQKTLRIHETLNYIWDTPPEPESVTEIVPNLYMVRVPLPFKLDHVHCWIIKDETDLHVFDTGLNRDETKDLWRRVIDSDFKGCRVKSLTLSHFHPDHIGLTGWFKETYQPDRIYMSRIEWFTSRAYSTATDEEMDREFRKHFTRFGIEGDQLEKMSSRGNSYARKAGIVPFDIDDLYELDQISYGGFEYDIITGSGHAPDQLGLIDHNNKLFICFDLILPQISPVVSIAVDRPRANPLKDFYATMEKLQSVPDDYAVYPSHGLPFYGLHARARDLIKHHDDRLDIVMKICAQPRTGLEICNRLFTRALDDHQIMFAIGETLSHINYLVDDGRLSRDEKDGVYFYSSN